jgi:multiple sugar transport system substrate-binding protein
VGEKNGTDVIVDHMAATEVPARGAAEAAAGQGHDLFHFISPPAAYERQVIDHADIVREVEKRHGKMIPLAQRSTFNPKTGKYFAFSDSYVPTRATTASICGARSAFPKGPTRGTTSTGGRRIKEKFGSPPASASPRRWTPTWRCARSSGRSAAPSRTSRAPALASKETIAALKFARALYREAETPEVFTWDPSSNNRAMLSGTLVLRPERDLRHAHRREGEPRHGREDRPDAGARGPRSAGSRPST